jgi:hypothetical protein
LPESVWSSPLARTVEDATVRMDVGPGITGDGDTLYTMDYMEIYALDRDTGATETVIHTAEHPYALVAADLDGDGFGDLAWPEHDEAKVYLGPWTGTRDERDQDVSWYTEGFGITALDAGDFDQDGVNELVFVQRDGVYLLPAAVGGDASASGANRLLAPADDDLDWPCLAVGDSDLDGAEDLAIGDRSMSAPNGNVWLFHGPIVGVVELGAADAWISTGPGEGLGAALAFGEPGELLVGLSWVGEVRMYEVP